MRTFNDFIKEKSVSFLIVISAFISFIMLLNGSLKFAFLFEALVLIGILIEITTIRPDESGNFNLRRWVLQAEKGESQDQSNEESTYTIYDNEIFADIDSER